MDEFSGPPRLTRLNFHGPLSEERATRMIRRLTESSPPATVLDIGCGWGEFLLRVLESAPQARGVGIDLREDDLARGRSLAGSRGLAERVEFVQESGVGSTREPADLVLCLGASQALVDSGSAHTEAALAALRGLVSPGGRVLLGEGFWQRPPTESELAAMWPGATADDHLDLATLTALTTEAGFRPAWIETATGQEWEEFESAYRTDKEEWLAVHSDHPLAARVREETDRHRDSWLRGYRDVLGIAYLTLVPVG